MWDKIYIFSTSSNGQLVPTASRIYQTIERDKRRFDDISKKVTCIGLFGSLVALLVA